jgi:hypothetical protein
VGPRVVPHEAEPLPVRLGHTSFPKHRMVDGREARRLDRRPIREVPLLDQSLDLRPHEVHGDLETAIGVEVSPYLRHAALRVSVRSTVREHDVQRVAVEIEVHDRHSAEPEPLEGVEGHDAPIALEDDRIEGERSSGAVVRPLVGEEVRHVEPTASDPEAVARTA